LQAITAAAGEEEAHEKAYDDHKSTCRHTSPTKWYRWRAKVRRRRAMDQKHLFFFHLLLGDEDLAIELFYMRIYSLVGTTVCF